MSPNVAVFISYSMAACAILCALLVELKFLWSAGMSLGMLARPWKIFVVMGDPKKVFEAPGQITRFAAFVLLLLTAFVALVTGRSIQVWS